MAIVRQGEVLEVGKKISGNFKDGFKFKDGIASKHIMDPNVWSMNIRDVEVIMEGKSRSKKSVAGRAIVGGVLLGGAGAVVGGVTAKNKKQIHAAISYHNGMQDILEVSPFELNDLKRIAKQNREKGNTIYRDIEKDYSNYPLNQNANKQGSQGDTGSLLIEIFSIVFWVVVLIMILKWLFT
ncbi:hypothetical protein [Bacillus tropicus]|uniref:hypothetical protein n=1 Tax=Bacillus tropicus TaxID=2026188 RepID=UPI0035DE3F05